MVKDWELRYKMLYEAWMMEVQELEKNGKQAGPQTKKYYTSLARTLEKALEAADRRIKQVTYDTVSL